MTGRGQYKERTPETFSSNGHNTSLYLFIYVCLLSAIVFVRNRMDRISVRVSPGTAIGEEEDSKNKKDVRRLHPRCIDSRATKAIKREKGTG